MTVRVTRVHLDHAGGTKFYRMFVVEDETGAIWVQQWGKINTRGQMEARGFRDGVRAREALKAHEHTKKGRGYRVNGSSFEALSLDDKRAFMALNELRSLASNKSEISQAIARFLDNGPFDPDELDQEPVVPAAQGPREIEQMDDWGVW